MAQKKFISPREERVFTEPVVRFRKIRGRIVPIVNKKRVGQELDRIGNIAAGGGAALAGGAAALRIAKNRTSRSRKLFDTTSSLLKKLPKPKSRLARVSTAPIKFASRNPIKLGLAFLGAGILTKGAAFDLEASSEFGFDVLPRRTKSRGSE